jgi:SPP1 family predicted phage head-tail adaptor
MRQGRLDRRIAIVEYVEQVSATTGERGMVPIKLCDAWARRVPMGVAERLFGRELVSEESVTWSIRHRRDVKPNMVVVWRGKEYRIEGVQDGDGRDYETLLLTIAEATPGE